MAYTPHKSYILPSPLPPWFKNFIKLRMVIDLIMKSRAIRSAHAVKYPPVRLEVMRRIKVLMA